MSRLLSSAMLFIVFTCIISTGTSIQINLRVALLGRERNTARTFAVDSDETFPSFLQRLGVHLDTPGAVQRVVDDEHCVIESLEVSARPRA